MKKLYNRVGGEWLYRFYVLKFTEFISNCPSLSRNKHLAGKEKYIREEEDSESGNEKSYKFKDVRNVGDVLFL